MNRHREGKKTPSILEFLWCYLWCSHGHQTQGLTSLMVRHALFTLSYLLAPELCIRDKMEKILIKNNDIVLSSQKIILLTFLGHLSQITISQTADSSGRGVLLRFFFFFYCFVFNQISATQKEKGR